MTESEHHLLKWVGELSASPCAIDRLSSAILATTPGRYKLGYATRSTLNNDGSPLQVCVTYAATQCKIRLIGDPATYVADHDTRWSEAQQALTHLLALTGTDALAPIFAATPEHILQRGRRQEVADAGLFWLAGGLDGGVALYVNARWGQASDRWSDAGVWLQRLLPHSEASNRLIRALLPVAGLVSVGLEGTSSADVRAKLYWRLHRPLSLDRLRVPLLTDDGFGDFFRLLLKEDAIALSGLVFSVGFALANGVLSDAKVDICAHCLQRSPEWWVQKLEHCCQHFHLCPLHIGDGLVSSQCVVAFTGFGLDVLGNHRLNVYLKVPSGNQCSPTSH